MAPATFDFPIHQNGTGGAGSGRESKRVVVASISVSNPFSRATTNQNRGRFGRNYRFLLILHVGFYVRFVTFFESFFY